VPLLDWGHTVPCAPSLRQNTWKHIDFEADEVIELAAAGPLFGALTRDYSGCIPLSVICNAIGVKDASQRRGNLARGLHRHLIDLPADHPTQRCIQAEASANPTPTNNFLNRLARRYQWSCTPPTHKSSVEWGVSNDIHGAAINALCTLPDQDQRHALLKLRCNTSTFFPGDALRMVPIDAVPFHESRCADSRNSLQHKLFACGQAWACRI